MAKKVMIIGKREPNDYMGAKTQHIFNALTAHGVNTIVHDVNSGGDPPPGVNACIYLGWILLLNEGWARFLKTIHTRKYLYTDNFWWYDECRMKFMRAPGFDLEEMFDSVAFATTENSRWWPKGKFDFWGVCIDEDLAMPRQPQNYIWVDEIWPENWSSGIYTARHVLDIAIPEVKKRFGVGIMSQKTEAPWVDEKVADLIDNGEMLSVVAGAKAFITTHEEALGLMQFEALVCGVPVVTNPIFSKSEVFEAGDDAVFHWSWPKRKDATDADEIYADPAQAAEQMVEAIGHALMANRAEIRQTAVSIYGKKVWFGRTPFSDFA
jgi:hypothetical protein